MRVEGQHIRAVLEGLSSECKRLDVSGRESPKGVVIPQLSMDPVNHHPHHLPERERSFIERMQSDRKLKAFIEGSKRRIYGTETGQLFTGRFCGNVES